MKAERNANFTILDPPSESILAWEQEGFSKTNYAGFSFEGPCDPAALNEAVRQAQAAWPHFHANLIPVRVGLYRTFAWHVRPEPGELVVRDFTTMESPPEDLEAWIHPQMAGEMNRLQDLSREYPVKYILFLLPGDRCCFVIRFHHVAADAGALFTFVRDALRIYHEKVTGTPPDWGDISGMHSQAGIVKPVQPVSGWRFLRDTLGEMRKYPLHRAANIASETDGKPGRNMIRHIITDGAVQKALRDRARGEGGSLSDLATAASKLALQQWNDSRGAPSEIMVNGLAVNQRLRRPPSEVEKLGNPMSVITIPSNAADRLDPERLLRHVVDCRRRKMDQGFDILISRMGQKILSAGRLLPLGLRYPFLRLFLEQRLSYFITNVGVPYPKMEGGRPTGETALKQVGRMELVDIHSSIGATKKTSSVLILRTLFGRLYLIFAFGRHRVAPEDATAFYKLVVEKMLNYL